MSKKQCNRNNGENMNNEFINEETRISSSYKNMPNFIILWSSNQREKNLIMLIMWKKREPIVL